MKSYTELIKLDSFEERFEYLKTVKAIGVETFGYDRYLNQTFYSSPEWRKARRKAILRDNGCDLGVDGYNIPGMIYVHHIDPLTVEDVLERSAKCFDLDNLISVSRITHDAIHYGGESALPEKPIERYPNDTCPWRCNNDQLQ